jgi:hypothetical protein
VLYWAAFLGKKDIVEYIIKKGYSPFLSERKGGKNAIFATIDGNQLATLKLILSFNYLSSDMQKFEL